MPCQGDPLDQSSSKLAKLGEDSSAAESGQLLALCEDSTELWTEGLNLMALGP